MISHRSRGARASLRLPLACALVAIAGAGAIAQESAPTPDAIQQQTDALEKQKELLDAQKALAKAQADLAEAEAAAFKAKLGALPASGYTDAVELKEKQGQLEAALLAAQAVREAAGTIDGEIRKAVSDPKPILAIAASEVPTFQNLIAYRAQVDIVTRALEDAVAASKKARPVRGTKAAAVPPLAIGGTILDAAGRLLSYFRSDYTVGGVDVTLDDAIALYEVADRLSKPVDGKSFAVSLPAIYNPTAVADPGSFLVGDLTRLGKLRQTADAHARTRDAEARDLSKLATDEKDADTKAALLEDATERKSLAEALRGAIALFDTWFGKLSALDEKGSTSLVALAREMAIAGQLKDGHLLLIKVQKAGGGYLVRKNFWTFWGGTPLFHMGGAAVSFVLLDGATGQVKAAGVVPVHGGFVKAGRLRRALAR